MIREYVCGGCGRGKRKTTHYYKYAEKSGTEANQVVLWFQCGNCGHLYSIMRYVAEKQIGPSKWEVEDASRYKPGQA